MIWDIYKKNVKVSLMDDEGHTQSYSQQFHYNGKPSHLAIPLRDVSFY